MSSIYFADQRRQRQNAARREQQLQYDDEEESLDSSLFPPIPHVDRNDNLPSHESATSSLTSLTGDTGLVSIQSQANKQSAEQDSNSQDSSSSSAAEVIDASVAPAPFPAEPAAVEAVPLDESVYTENEGVGKLNQHRNRNLVIMAVVCCVLFIVLAAVGIAVAVSMGRQKSTGESVPISVSSPTAQPSDAPSSSPSETENPPLNDVCENAQELQLKESAVGSTRLATLEDYEQLGCGVADSDGPGVWFKVVGQGKAITASTCGGTNFKTRLAVFRADSSCQELECVAKNDPRIRGNCDLHASVIWSAEEDELYFILIRGWKEEVGDFQITIHSDLAPNDKCSGAILVEVQGNQFVQGSTVAATVDNAPCRGIQGGKDPGVFYRVVGTGSRVIVSTCWGTEFDTVISVFMGDCGTLRCVVSNDDFCGKQSRVTFDSVENENYYILVQGYFGGSGPFLLNVATEDTLYNDYCEDARSLPSETLEIGNNVYAHYDYGEADVFCSEDVQITGPTVWYHFFGTGGELLITLCHVGLTDFDTQVSLFTGSCDKLSCIGGNDEAEAEECGFTSELGFQSQPFEKYYVAVHGFLGEKGNFGIYLENLNNGPSFDSCDTAGGPVPLNDVVPVFLSVNASFGIGLFQCDGPLDVQSTRAGAWVYLQGDGGNITASACDDPAIRVFAFSGDCQSLACTEGTPRGGCSVTFSSVGNQNYYLFLSSLEVVNKTALSLTTTGKASSSNDVCEQAIALEIDSGTPVPGTTVGATVSKVPDDFCGEIVESPGVWYSVLGTGKGIAVGLCLDTNFDTRISIFEGSCDSLVCVGGNDDWCGLQSAFGWVSKNQTTYYILVHGSEGTVGDFGILVVTS